MAGVGKYLKQAREKKNYTLEEMADLTNMETKYLQALEVEEYEQLPSPFYVRVFLKTYAKYSQLNVHSVMQLYESSQAQEQAPTPTEPKMEAIELPRRSPSQNKKVSSLWLIAAIILLLGMIYILFQ